MNSNVEKILVRIHWKQTVSHIRGFAGRYEKCIRIYGGCKGTGTCYMFAQNEQLLIWCCCHHYTSDQTHFLRKDLSSKTTVSCGGRIKSYTLCQHWVTLQVPSFLTQWCSSLKHMGGWQPCWVWHEQMVGKEKSWFPASSWQSGCSGPRGYPMASKNAGAGKEWRSGCYAGISVLSFPGASTPCNAHKASPRTNTRSLSDRDRLSVWQLSSQSQG